MEITTVIPVVLALLLFSFGLVYCENGSTAMTKKPNSIHLIDVQLHGKLYLALFSEPMQSALYFAHTPKFVSRKRRSNVLKQRSDVSFEQPRPFYKVTFSSTLLKQEEVPSTKAIDSTADKLNQRKGRFVRDTTDTNTGDKSTSQEDTQDKFPKGTIFGVTLGGIGFILLIAILCWYGTKKCEHFVVCQTFCCVGPMDMNAVSVLMGRRESTPVWFVTPPSTENLAVTPEDRIVYLGKTRRRSSVYETNKLAVWNSSLTKSKVPEKETGPRSSTTTGKDDITIRRSRAKSDGLILVNRQNREYCQNNTSGSFSPSCLFHSIPVLENRICISPDSASARGPKRNANTANSARRDVDHDSDEQSGNSDSQKQEHATVTTPRMIRIERCANESDDDSEIGSGICRDRNSSARSKQSVSIGLGQFSEVENGMTLPQNT